MRILSLLAAGILLTACASSGENTKKGAAGGAALGAIAGAVIGHQMDRSGGALKGALIGGAAGGALGAGVGSYMDKQQSEFDQQLASEKQAHQVEVERLKNENLKITMTSEASFDFNSSGIKPAFAPTLDKVAGILNRYNRSNIRIIGHTDSVGSEAYNQKLSVARAESVARHLERQGVNPVRVRIQGKGETEPRASNNSEAGRQLNRRVEMLIIPDQNI